MLTPEYGDTDLFVKVTTDPYERALSSNYDYRSGNAQSAVDIVVVPKEDLASNSIISVLVYGFHNAKYSLVAYLLNDTATLLNGERGSVAEHNTTKRIPQVRIPLLAQPPPRRF